MKKILLILFIPFLLCGCREEKVFNYHDISIYSITILNKKEILIKGKDKDIIFSLDKGKKQKRQDNYFYVYYDSYKNKLEFDDISIIKDKNITINVQNNKFCIYTGTKSKKEILKGCNFVYIYKCDENCYLFLDENIYAIFYNDDVILSNKFLEDLYLNWTDIYSVDNTKITVISLEGEYNILQTN